MNSHMFFTVHIYQYRVEKNSKNAGGGENDNSVSYVCEDTRRILTVLCCEHFLCEIIFFNISCDVLSPVHGGRSRLHLIDLASCEGYTGSKKDGGASSMSLSGLGNVIISLINGAKHVPHRCVQPISFKKTGYLSKVLNQTLNLNQT